MQATDAVRDIVELIAYWRDSLRDRIETCGPTPEELALVEHEAELLKRVCRALTWAMSKSKREADGQTPR